MGEIMIELPTHETSKEGEVEILEKLAEKLDTTQSYLSSLFSQALVKWVREMVHNDYAPDIYKAYGTALEERNEKMQRITYLETDIVVLSDRVQGEKDAGDTLRKDIENLRIAIGKVEEQIEINNTDTNRIIDERDDYRKQAYDASVSNMELKARLFDYMVAETED